MTTDQLPPLPDLVKLAEQAGFQVDEGWLTCFEPPHTHPVPEMPSLRKFAELVGLQCAEAAVERERARCLLEAESMVESLLLSGEDSGKSHREYAAGLLKFVADRIRK